MEWISVKDRLPRPHDPVIVCYGRKNFELFAVGYYAPIAEEWRFETTCHTITSVTNWMPLPAPPKEDE